MSMLHDRASCSHAHVLAVYPCWMSMMNFYATCFCSCPCCMFMLRVLAVFLCCVSLLYVYAAGTCCVSMLYIFPCNCSWPCHTSCSCRKSCPWCMSWKGNEKLEAKWNVTLKALYGEKKRNIYLLSLFILERNKKLEAKLSENKWQNLFICFANTSETELKGTVSPDITFYFRFCKIKSVLSVRPLRVFKFFYFVVL